MRARRPSLMLGQAICGWLRMAEPTASERTIAMHERARQIIPSSASRWRSARGRQRVEGG
jgi:hypothetical protein